LPSAWQLTALSAPSVPWPGGVTILRVRICESGSEAVNVRTTGVPALVETLLDVAVGAIPAPKLSAGERKNEAVTRSNAPSHRKFPDKSVSVASRRKPASWAYIDRIMAAADGRVKKIARERSLARAL
jgi:hypothetical protein